MASASKLSRNSATAETRKDLISNFPMHVTDNILQHLTLSEQAKMSALSKKWRHTWSCMKSLVFGEDFWEKQRNEDGKVDCNKCNCIISSILFSHNGPLHEFHLTIPENDEETLNLISPWLSFLSRNGVKKITLENLNESHVPLPSTIFSCAELEELRLHRFFMNRPPAEFKRFAHLRKLELISTVFKHDAVVNVIANCPKLVRLELNNDDGSLIANNLVINAPILEDLCIIGKVRSLTFRNVPKLTKLELYLEGRCSKNHLSTTMVEALIYLETSCRALEILHLGGSSYKLLVAGGIMKSFPLALTHLQELCLYQLELDDFSVDSFTYGLIQSCPLIKKLAVSVIPSKIMDTQHNFEYDNNYKLKQLQKVEFKGITGSSAELKLIKYLLNASVILENLFIVLGNLDDSSEVKLQRELNRFQRASPKTQIVFLQKSVMWL